MSKEFSFTDNKDWLLPFLKDFKKQNDTDAIEDFAIKNVEKIFKKNRVDSVFSMFSNSTNKEPWKECAKSYTLNEIANDCRESPGFNKKFVPTSFSYNNSKEKGSDEYKQSEQSYDYLRYSDDIQMVIGTPGSDYTRRDDVLHKYRLIEYLQKQNIEHYKSYTWVDCILDAYNEEIKIDTIVKQISKIPEFKDFHFLALHFHGDLNADYNMDFINGLEKERKKQKPRAKETSPIPIQQKSTKLNSFFDKTGGGGKKKTRKKRKSKTSKKTSKKRTIKSKRR